MEIFCPPTEHVTFLPSQLQPDTGVWLLLLLPEKGDIFEGVRENVHTPSHRWHWQFCSMCWVCCEQEMAVSCLHCFWCMNCYLFSFPGEILCIGRGCSVVHNITNTVRPKVFPKNTALEDIKLSVLCWEIHWNRGSSQNKAQQNNINTTFLEEISFLPTGYDTAKLWYAANVLIQEFSTQDTRYIQILILH